MVALNRIKQFLYLKEYNDKQIEKLPKESNTAISISNVSFGLDRRDNIKEVILLKNIDLHINKGELVCIIGDVGSGKTNLLNAILNNLYVYYGKDLIGNIKINGKIGYVSQVPWIVNDTLRNNILFYKDDLSNQSLYFSQILRFCRDFKKSTTPKDRTFRYFLLI